MPELAEVETVRNVLKSQILNEKMFHIEVLYPKMIENDIEEFKKIIFGNSFIDIQRRGKYLIFELENDYYLISHLRMEGKYFIKDMYQPIEKHEHVIFYFKKYTLRYHDTRKFGRMKLIPKEELEDYFKDLGPDANSDIDFSYIKPKLAKKKPIKTLLLDQSIIAGLGNIYVDEVLYKAKIHPLEMGCNLTDEDILNILKFSKEILNKAILYKGTTIRSYTSSLGVKGEYQQFLCVHTKEICPCKSKIEVIKVGGRSSYYCPNCQKLKNAS